MIDDVVIVTGAVGMDAPDNRDEGLTAEVVCLVKTKLSQPPRMFKTL
jgi:hypothetical protein